MVLAESLAVRLRKVAVIWVMGQFSKITLMYNPGLPIAPQNPTLTRMPTASSTISLCVSVFGTFLSIDTLFASIRMSLPKKAYPQPHASAGVYPITLQKITTKIQFIDLGRPTFLAITAEFHCKAVIAIVQHC